MTRREASTAVRPRTRRSRGSALGISLVEALVALAVLGFGLMAYVGVQSTLRINGDLARQRAEATRIAQDVIEDWRSFRTLRADPNRADPHLPDRNAYDDIASAGPTQVPRENAIYEVERTVVADPALGHKTVVVDVRWPDRAGDPQSLRFASVIAGVAPDLAGTLAVPGGGALGRRVAGRHPAIPTDAVRVHDQPGRSQLPITQPDGSVVTLVFDDFSGLITSLCMQPGACVPATALLLSGHVRYATTPTPPTPRDAEIPPSPVQPDVEVEVRLNGPTPTTVACFEQAAPLQGIRYFCPVPIVVPPPGTADPAGTLGTWSGRVALTGRLPGGLPLAESIADRHADRFRVCRYTPHRDHRAVGSETPPMRNADTPLDYRHVRTPLTHQNFLVIRAGDGTRAFDCPDDDPTTEFVNGRTWHHQPWQ